MDGGGGKNGSRVRIPDDVMSIQWNLSIVVTVLAGHLTHNSQGSRSQSAFGVHFNLC